MGAEVLRAERRRVRSFFAGLIVVSAVLDVVGAIIVQHQTRSEVLQTILPPAVTLGGRTGAVLSGLALLLLAGGIARGKRVAARLTMLALAATIVFVLVKDLDFEAAALFAWVLFGLWWFRHHFNADSAPSRVRWGVGALGLGVLAAILYSLAGAALLETQLRPEFGIIRTLESLALAVAGSPTRYHALTQRADWFLSTLPIVSYGLVICALVQLLRPAFAPRPAGAERVRVHRLLGRFGYNHISHLAVHGASSYHWTGQDACVAFTLRGRTALALGDPVAPPDAIEQSVSDFVAFCDRQDWIPAFYQVDGVQPYKKLGLTAVSIGAEAMLDPPQFSLSGRKRADLRYAVHRSAKEGVEIAFARGPEALRRFGHELHAVSGSWLHSRHSPELGYSLGTLASLEDPDIVVGTATSPSGRLEAFVSWLPVSARGAWTLDLMRRRPDGTYGVIEALIVRSIEEAGRRGVNELSLGMTPRILSSRDTPSGADRALRAMYWGLDRFQRSATLHRFKEKFGPRWEERYLVVPSAATLPEVMVALVRAHLPPLSASAAWLRSIIAPPQGDDGERRAVAA